MPEALITTMKSRKLHGMAEAVADLAPQQGPALKQAERILSDLLKAEVAEREVRSIQYQLKAARSRIAISRALSSSTAQSTPLS